MTFVTVAQATARLGIDAKTLRRWLAEARLSLQSHPIDGRKKGLSVEDLHLLARLHQRRLLPLPQEPPVCLTDGEPELVATLLALPERLDALQAQLTALQQQMTALTGLLQQRPEPVSTAAPAKPKRTAKPTSLPARPPRAAKAPRKSAQVIARVEYGEEGHYVLICPRQGLLPFEPDTPEWFAWLSKQVSFRFVGKAGHFTAHHRVTYGAWRAHRHIRNHSFTLRLAPTQELTMAVLEQAAATLQAHLK